MESYLANWKLFRKLSNEIDVTAKHLLTQERWPHRPDITLVDLGCGDGRITEKIIHQSCEHIAEVRLIDPHGAVLRNAEELIRETQLNTEVEVFEDTAEALLPHCLINADVVLAVHVVYLMKEGVLERIVNTMPEGVPLYVVFDAPGSVFSRLWTQLAPKKYLERSKSAHLLLKNLDPDRFSTAYSEITASLSDPMAFHDDEKKLGILSILSYSDTHDLEREHLEWIEGVLWQYRVDGKIICASSCYEVVRRPHGKAGSLSVD